MEEKIPDDFLKFCHDNCQRILELKRLGVFSYNIRAGSATFHWDDAGRFRALKDLNYKNPPAVDNY